MARGLCAAILLAAAAGCPAPEGVAPIPPLSAGKVHVRVFTQPSPVRSVASAGPYVFVATDHDVERWSSGGEVDATPIKAVTSEQIVALAPDPERKWLWVLTATGLGHYDLAA